MSDEAERVRQDHQARDGDERLWADYHLSDPSYLLLMQQRERQLLALLRRHGFAERLGGARILDIGCGTGELLLDLVRYGARVDRLTGLDPVPEHIVTARHRLPGADLRHGVAANLADVDGRYDLVCQFGVLSTMLDRSVQQRVTQEMRRVTRSDGLIISYDVHRASPGNSGTWPVTAAALRALFPDCTIEARSVTLAAPLARLVVRRSWLLAEVLAWLPRLHSHLLAALRPAR